MPSALRQIAEIIVRTPGIEPVEKEDCIDAITGLNQKQHDTILPVLQDDPAWAKVMIKNYQAKRAAVITRKQNLWDEIIQQEIAMLENISQGKG